MPGGVVFSISDRGEVELDIDGCLECGTAALPCGPEVLDWNYPNGESGVQFRFG